MSIELVMLSNHLILCFLLLLPSIFPSLRVYSNESALHHVAKVLELQVSITYLLFSSVQSLSHVRLFVTPWTEACHASLSITNSRSLFKLVSIELVMLSNHLILCCPLLLLPSIFPSIKVFSNESVLGIKCQSIGGSASA